MEGRGILVYSNSGDKEGQEENGRRKSDTWLLVPPRVLSALYLGTLFSGSQQNQDIFRKNLRTDSFKSSYFMKEMGLKWKAMEEALRFESCN